MDTQKKSEALEIALTAAGDTVADLKKVAAAAITIVAEQEAEISEAEELNADLQVKLEKLKSGEKITPEIDIDGKTYDVVHAVNVDGTVYKPEAIAADLDVATKLLKGNSSALVLQPAKATE